MRSKKLLLKTFTSGRDAFVNLRTSYSKEPVLQLHFQGTDIFAKWMTFTQSLKVSMLENVKVGIESTISHLEFLIFKLSNVDNVASPNYIWFFPEPTHNFLDHPNKQHCTVSVRCILPRETANSVHMYTQANKHSCHITCSLSHVLWSVTSHHQ